MFCAETSIVLNKPEKAGAHPKDAASAAALATVDEGVSIPSRGPRLAWVT
jgi:hypothetical protein